jgi:hypothetical protein
VRVEELDPDELGGSAARYEEPEPDEEGEVSRTANITTQEYSNKLQLLKRLDLLRDLLKKVWGIHCYSF